MVRIRMRRTGSNKDIAYRVVVADMRSPRDGKCIETLGWYNPKQAGDNYQVKLDRIEYWRSKGAQISERVAAMLKRAQAVTPVAPVAAAPLAVAETPAAEAPATEVPVTA